MTRKQKRLSVIAGLGVVPGGQNRPSRMIGPSAGGMGGNGGHPGGGFAARYDETCVKKMSSFVSFTKKAADTVARCLMTPV